MLNSTSHVLCVIVNIYIHTIAIDARTGTSHIEFNTGHFIGSFIKLGKATIASSCLFVCLSIRLSAYNNSAPTAHIFMKFDV